MWQLISARKLFGVLLLASIGIGGHSAASTNVQPGQHRSIGVVGVQAEIEPDVIIRPGFALLLGASRYHSPRWTNLTAIPGEIELVGNALRRQGFAVRTELDLPSTELFRVMREFIGIHGASPENRVVIYFAGHGYSRHNGDRGYIVPIDAPHPHDDLQRFLALAVDMTQITAWARQIEAAHALFIFDSCFSGTVLQQRGESAPPPLLIRRLSASPVRQFITAGTAGELVPAKSDFAPALAAALEQGLADLDGDGFITGTELGIYLQGHISQFGHQTPWHGKLSDPAMTGGEFIFRSSAPQRVAAPQPRHSGTLAIVSNPSGATVYVDGQRSGTTPLTIADLHLGERRVEIRADGYETTSMNVRVQSGVMQHINAELRNIQSHGRLWVDTDAPNARIELKGVHTAYFPGMELLPGRYQVMVSAPGYQPKTVSADIELTTLRLVVSLERQPERVHELRSLGARERQSAPSAQSMTATTCWAMNTLGYSFYWVAPSVSIAQSQAVRLCQQSTPIGAYCRPTGCG